MLKLGIKDFKKIKKFLKGKSKVSICIQKKYCSVYVTLEFDSSVMIKLNQLFTRLTGKSNVTGKSNGFAFVRFSDDWDAEMAMNDLNGKEFRGRRLKVVMAKGRNNNFGSNRESPRRFHQRRLMCFCVKFIIICFKLSMFLQLDLNL